MRFFLGSDRVIVGGGSAHMHVTALLVLAFSLLSADAQCAFESFSPTTGFAASLGFNTGNNWLPGNSFVAETSCSVAQVQVSVSVYNGPITGLQMGLWLGDLPSTRTRPSPFATSSLTNVTGLGPLLFTFPTPPSLVLGQNYTWVIFTSTVPATWAGIAGSPVNAYAFGNRKYLDGVDATTDLYWAFKPVGGPITTGDAPTADVNPASSSSNTLTIIIGASVGGGVALCLVIAVIIFLVVRKKRNTGSSDRARLAAPTAEAGVPMTVMQANNTRPPSAQLTPSALAHSDTNYMPVPSSLALQAPAPVGTVSKATLARSAAPADPWHIDFKEIQIVKELGKGAYGNVYMGKWRMQQVAVKIIASNDNSMDVTEFKRELELIKRLRPHKNIIQTYGVCSDPLALVMAYMAMGSLDKYLISNAKISLAQMVSWMKDIAAGISHLHHERIVHRDLAARNVLLSETLVAVVADFGYSRTIETEAASSTTKSDVGPVKWMSVESLLYRQYSQKSDVWSFGVTCWEILCRSEPYPGMNVMEVAFAVRDGGRLQVPDWVPSELHTLINACWCTSPDERPDIFTIFQHLETIERNLPPGM